MTFDAEFHFYYAVILCFYGVLLGAGYDLFYFIQAFLKSKISQAIFDVLFWIFAFLLFLSVNLKYKLSGLRLYFILAFFGGFLLYYKSFHKVVAFFVKKVYNKVNKTLSSLKSKIKTTFSKRKINERTKGKKHINGKSSNGGTVAIVPIKCVGISMGSSRKRSKSEKGVNARKTNA